MELWGLRVDDLLTRLRDVDARPLSMGDLGSGGNYESVRADIASVLGSGESGLTDEQAVYVAEVARSIGVHLGSLAYSSSGGGKLRTCLAGAAAGEGPSNMVENIMERSLDGMSTSGYPGFGWLTSSEARFADDLQASASSDPECATWIGILANALAWVRVRGLDLLAIHT